MRNITSVIFFVFALIFTFSAITSTNAQEIKIKKNDLPATVTKAFHSAYPDAKILGTAKETEKGVTYFEIESKDGAVRRDLLYTIDGKVAEIEEALSDETIPSFVKSTIEKKFKDVKYKKGEKIVRNSVTKYEVIIEASEVKYDVVCDANGKILTTTKLKNEELDENDND